MFTQLKRLPWAQIPVGDRRRDTGHGRKETRTVKAVTVATDGGLGFPHVQQAVRITRTRTIAGKTSRETAYLVVSLPATHAQPADLQAWARHEWLIENQVHHVRDVTFGEDLHQARIGTGPAVIATLRNASIGFHRTNGDTNIARATRRANRRPHDLISAVTSSYPRTQPCMELRLLGAVEAFAHGQRVDLGPRKQRFFLSVLALEVNRLVPVERLVELAWPISPPRTATHAVRVCISRLRSILGTVPCGTALTLDSVGSGYMLPGDPMAIDVHRFRVLLARARASHDNEHKVTLLDEALQLWSGRPLSGSAPADSHERLCHGLTESRLAALEDWLAAHLALGRHRDVLDELVGLVQAYPMRERLAGHRPLCLHRAGRAGDALAVYRRIRDRPAADLGVDPGPEVQRLHVAILRNETAAASGEAPSSSTGRPVGSPQPAVPAQLPPNVAGFTGRRQALEELDVLLSTEAVSTGRVAVISGTAKTALAVHWAHQMRTRFPDGQLYLNLGGHSSLAPVALREALARCLRALRVPPHCVPVNVDEAAAVYRALLADRRMLVLLDDAAYPIRCAICCPPAPAARLWSQAGTGWPVWWSGTTPAGLPSAHSAPMRR